MILGLVIVIGICLLIMSLMDIKHKAIPSILPTSIILFLAIYRVYEDPNKIFFGVLGFIFAYLLWEFDFFRGKADLKIMIIISLMLESLVQFGGLMVLTVFFGFFYQLFIIKILQKKKGQEIPFLPALLCVYIALMLVIYLV